MRFDAGGGDGAKDGGVALFSTTTTGEGEGLLHSVKYSLQVIIDTIQPLNDCQLGTLL